MPMPPVRYIFIDEDGRVFATSRRPTRRDYDFANVGMLTIVSLLDGSYYGRARKWLPIPKGRLGRATSLDDQPTPPFHAPASWFEGTREDA